MNTTDSAVRITHIPTGLVVTCQSERSQRQNHERAMRILLARVSRRCTRSRRTRSSQPNEVSRSGRGDRSEKIRTYNFPQNRVTDHRIGYTMHGIQQVMDGDIDDLLEALRNADSDDGKRTSMDGR